MAEGHSTWSLSLSLGWELCVRVLATSSTLASTARRNNPVSRLQKRRNRLQTSRCLGLVRFVFIALGGRRWLLSLTQGHQPLSHDRVPSQR